MQNSKVGKTNPWWLKSKYYLKVFSDWEKGMDFSFGILFLNTLLCLLGENLWLRVLYFNKIFLNK